MTRAPTVTGGGVQEAVATTIAALRPASGADWSVRAGPLRWTCRRTAVHIADALVAYAAQVVAEPANRYVPFTFGAPRGATGADLLELIGAMGRILASTVAAAPPTSRGWHPYGVSDPEGFAAMGVTETLVHGSDLAAGLDVPFDPPRALCARTLLRLFPDGPVHPDPWELLLWATGRTALPRHARRRSWRWQGEPRPADDGRTIDATERR